MDKMNIKNAIEFAIENEIEAEKLYEKLMNLTEKSETKTLFDDLRKMEIGHRKKLEDLDLDVFKEKHDNLISIDYKISDNLVVTKAEDVKTFQDGLILAAHNEKKAYEVYIQFSELFSKDNNNKLAEFFQLLAKEELEHKKHVEFIYDDQILKEN